MKVILENIQNQIKSKDTTTKKVIKHYKLTPAIKVKSKDGVMMPKEVLYMTKLVPSISPPIEKKEDFSILPYALYGVVILTILIAIKIILNKIRRVRPK